MSALHSQAPDGFADGARSVLLISAPWRLSNWPSLAVGVLKSHLLRHGIPADGFHLHFDVAARLGFDRYDQVANGWELGEALYCALYAPDERDAILARTAERLARNGEAELAHWARNGALDAVEKATLASIDTVDLARYGVIGLSVGALQLGASLYLAQLFKRRAPHLRIVLGGGGVLGVPGANLLRAAACVDAIVDGEGEAALLGLAKLRDWTADSLTEIPNVVFRDGDSALARGPQTVQADIDVADAADMAEFYAAARQAGYPRAGLVQPVEASRGCAWEHRRGDGRLRGCTFCGLYRNSPTARQKSLDALWDEICRSVARTQVLELSFVDAYLPSDYVKALLRRLAEAPFDATLFCETRCDLDEEMAELFARAGTRRLQLGVEAFHTAILTKMEKGVRAIDNVSSIKLCEEFAIPFQYNVMLRVPGVSADELRQSEALFARLHAYRPPSKAEFYLDRGSRMYGEPSSFGIRPGSLDHEPLCFLPRALGRAPLYQVVPFEAQSDTETDEAWARIETAVETWQTQYQRMRSEGTDLPLSYRDSGDSVTIHDHRSSETTIITLSGGMREVFLACDRLTLKRQLRARIPGEDADTLQSMLDTLEEMGLLMQEANQVLALPVRARLPNGTPRGWQRRA